MSKIAIIGAGKVGITSAYTIILNNIVDELVIVDIDEKRLKGEELDLKPCAYFDRPVKITCSTDYSHCKGADVVVITAGIPRAPGDSRLDLTKKNLKIMDDIAAKILPVAPEAVYLIVSNPVDILTYYFLKKSGLPKSRVFGTGTAIDTARLSAVLAEEFKVHPQHVEAYMLGEHGDSAFVHWSEAKIKGRALSSVGGYDAKKVDSYIESVRKMGADIIANKAATYYSIGIVVSEVVEAVLSNASRVMPASVLLEKPAAGDYAAHGEGYEGVSDVCLSVPCVINSNGANPLPVKLNAKEKESFRKSAEVIKEILKEI